MIRSFGLMASVMLMALVPANGQQAGVSAVQTGASSAHSDAEFPSKPELLKRIALYEDAERNAERTHPGMDSMVKIYQNLAALYEDAAMYTKSEDVMRREIALLRSGPQDRLANAIGHLAVLHIAMGDFRQAEKDNLEALRIRESAGDAVGVALSWTDLADLYVKERHFKQALDYAQKAMPVLADNPKADVETRIAVRQALAYALCGVKKCYQALPLLREALELQRNAYGPDSLIVGTGTYLLGYTYWQNGEMDKAADLMGRGTARMKVDLGWGHTIYVNAMSQYALFLRQRGQMEAAAEAEGEVRQAQSVVDARTWTTSTTAFMRTRPQ